MPDKSHPQFRRRPHILFIDDENIDRSQMAEAYLRQLAGDLVDAASAGMRSQPLDRRTVQVMEEAGLDIRRQQEKLVSRDLLLWADVIIVISDPVETLHAAIPQNAVEKRWLIAAPNVAEDTSEDGIEAYRATRDQVRGRVEGLARSMRLFYGRREPGSVGG